MESRLSTGIISFSLYWPKLKEYEIRENEGNLFIAPKKGLTKQSITWYKPCEKYPDILMDFISMASSIASIKYVPKDLVVKTEDQERPMADIVGKGSIADIVNKNIKKELGKELWSQKERERAELLLGFVNKYGLFGVSGTPFAFFPGMPTIPGDFDISFSGGPISLQENFILNYNESLSELMSPGGYYQGDDKLWKLFNHIKFQERFGDRLTEVMAAKITWGEILSSFPLPTGGNLSLEYKEKGVSLCLRTDKLIDELSWIYASMVLGQSQEIRICGECGAPFTVYFQGIPGQRKESGYCGSGCANKGRVKKTRKAMATAKELFEKGKTIEEIALQLERSVSLIEGWVRKE